MRGKGGQSVQSDQLATLRKRTMDREKAKYQELPIYQKVTDKLTYRGDVFEQNIDRVLDPSLSPLQPAMYVK